MNLLSNQWHERQEEVRKLPLVRVVARTERLDSYGCVTGAKETYSCGHRDLYAPKLARGKRRCTKCRTTETDQC